MSAEKAAAKIAQVEANAAQAVASGLAATAAIVDAAASDVAAAQETAQQIAAAAIAAPLAQQVAQLEQDAETWENEQEQLHASHAARFLEMESRMLSLQTRLEALEAPPALPAIVIPDQSLIPPASDETPGAPTITEALIVEPAKLPASEPSDLTNDAPRKPRTRML